MARALPGCWLIADAAVLATLNMLGRNHATLHPPTLVATELLHFMTTHVKKITRNFPVERPLDLRPLRRLTAGRTVGARRLSSGRPPKHAGDKSPAGAPILTVHQLFAAFIATANARRR
jgi:hypothetical protein